MAAEKYTLTYFDAPGRAEVTRLAFAAKGVDFTDKRVTSEEWQKLKPSIPQGQLPTLEIESGGKKTLLSQSGAIVRFVGRKYGLYGKTDLDQAMVDQVLETLEDFFKVLIKIFTASDEKAKEDLKAELGKTDAPKFLKYFDDMKGDRDWIVGNDMTIADLAVFSLFRNLPMMFGENSNKCYCDSKSFQAHAKRVSENPGISKWLAKQSAAKK